MRTPDHETLLAYASNELDGEAAVAVERHLARSPEAAAMVERYRLIASVLRADDSVDPPVETLRRAYEIFEPRRQTARPTPRWREWLDAAVATLTYDSRATPAAVRYSDTGNRLHLVYESDDIEVELQAQRTADGPAGEGRWRVMGQVNPLAAADQDVDSDAEGWPVAAMVTDDQGRVVAESRTDDRAMFTLDVEGGRYDVLLQTPAGLVRMPNIELP